MFSAPRRSRWGSGRPCGSRCTAGRCGRRRAVARCSGRPGWPAPSASTRSRTRLRTPA